MCRVEVSELQAALVQCREDLALKEALLLATDAQQAAARQAQVSSQLFDMPCELSYVLCCGLKCFNF